jgi:ATP-binding protein involved in chromosome partitioning
VSVDALRRAWAKAAESSAVDARLVAAGGSADEGPMPVRGRCAGDWPSRLRFEGALTLAMAAEGLAPGAFDLQWLAPVPRGPGDAADRARARLGMAPRPGEPVEIAAAPARGAARSAAARAEGKTPAKGEPQAVPGVRRTLAVASGKGGVGKSTVAVNLALALKARGLRTGVLDADVYGPSMPTMLGSFQPPKRRGERFLPPEAHGMPFLSLGLMVNPDQSVIWRGPLVQRMVRDMLQGTEWPELDVLVLDLPPGTGDVQLTLVQRALLSGAIIVTTPQDIALIDAARGLTMFQTLSVPVLGIVENMATWKCPHCAAESFPFGREGGEREARRLGVPFLGRVPLDTAVRECGDAGKPVVLRDPQNPAARAFAEIAEGIARSW